ncbi:hypothetical protein SUGI_0906030 [Cryptomeria japonica]|nr:hypothetical protein SUGI_0906030 [Cryptomeria japonica]
MLHDRSYLVAELEINMSKEQFLDKFGEDPKKYDLVINKTKRNEPVGGILTYEGLILPLQIYVLFPDEAKVGVKTIKTYVEQMKFESVFRTILVIQQNLTHGN